MSLPLLQDLGGLADLFSRIEVLDEQVSLVQLPEEARAAVQAELRGSDEGWTLWGADVEWVPTLPPNLPPAWNPDKFQPGDVRLFSDKHVLTAVWGQPMPQGGPQPRPTWSPGIHRTVEFLQAAGFNTTDSGDGVSNAGMECALPYPNVSMTCPPYVLVSEAKRLQALLAAKGITVEPLGPEDPGPPHIEASYDPSDEIAVITLMNVNDALLFKD